MRNTPASTRVDSSRQSVRQALFGAVRGFARRPEELRYHKLAVTRDQPLYHIMGTRLVVTIS